MEIGVITGIAFPFRLSTIGITSARAGLYCHVNNKVTGKSSDESIRDHPNHFKGLIFRKTCQMTIRYYTSHDCVSSRVPFWSFRSIKPAFNLAIAENGGDFTFHCLLPRGYDKFKKLTVLILLDSIQDFFNLKNCFR